MAYGALNRFRESACLVVAVDEDENLLGVGDRAYAYGKSLSGNRLGIVAEEARVYDSGVGGEVSYACA